MEPRAASHDRTLRISVGARACRRRRAGPPSIRDRDSDPRRRCGNHARVGLRPQSTRGHPRGAPILTLSPRTQVFVALGGTDMRKSFDTLTGLVRGTLDEDPLSGHLFVIANRGRTRLTMLMWDGSRMWVMAKARARHLAGPSRRRLHRRRETSREHPGHRRSCWNRGNEVGPGCSWSSAFAKLAIRNDFKTTRHTRGDRTRDAR